jgi:YegS/Rv2252/BmrU family lipid kinase
MKTIKAELLINTKSRRARHSYAELTAALEHSGIEITKVYELHGKDLHAELRKAAKSAPKLLIIGGGDGTVSSALDFFAGTHQNIAFIPLGTTNNFARSVGLPLTIQEAVHAIATRTVKSVDLGVINGRHFANVAGFGLSAKIAGSIKDSAKRKYGRFAYALEGATQLFTYKPFLVTIQDIDSKLELHFETRQLIVANGKYHAGRQIAADASLSNGELLIFPLGGASLWSFFWAMIDFYVGKRKRVRHGSFVIGRHVRISTSKTVPIEFDGEVALHTPAEATVASSAVHIWGAK